jgi:hypothetical protein
MHLQGKDTELLAEIHSNIRRELRIPLPELEQQSPVPREARNADETETGCAMQPSRRV